MSDHAFTIVEIAVFGMPAILMTAVLIGVLVAMATRRPDTRELRRLADRVRDLEAEKAINTGKLAAADKQIFALGRMISMLADLIVSSGLILPAEVQEYLERYHNRTVDYTDTEQIAHLLHVLDRFFDAGEIENLAFRLNVDFDNLRGGTKNEKARALIAYLDRRGLIDSLVEIIQTERPNLPWIGGRGPP